MIDLFVDIANMSLTATWLILAVIAFRGMFKKAPKWIICALWGLVAIRLVVPMNLESGLSLVPKANPINKGMEYIATAKVNGSGNFAEPNGYDMGIEYILKQGGRSVRPEQMWVTIFTVIWLIGAAAMLCYALSSYLSLRRKVAVSICVGDKVYECDEVASPFIFGIVKPRIYLPSGLKAQTKMSVLKHECAHLKRGDYIWKPLGFLLLSIYWFHPLCWVAYILLCRDIELACDEKVTSSMDHLARADYCQALLDCSVERRMVTVCPVAFGEVGVKNRVKSVIHYKKPAIWMILLALIAGGMVSVCFMTNPKSYVEGKTLNESSTDAEVALVEGDKKDEMLKKWADAFCDRDADTILTLVTDDVKESLKEQELLWEEDGYVSFGYSSPWPMWDEGSTPYQITCETGNANKAEILYYALTSDPHVWVWKEYIEYRIDGDDFVITKEELEKFNYIASGEEFYRAYPCINNTPMDYATNGLAESLNNMALKSTINDYPKLLEPVSAAKVLLNLLDNEGKVKVEEVEDDSFKKEERKLKITFVEDREEVYLRMVQPWGNPGIWIPQDFE